jgi:hypothetical protein
MALLATSLADSAGADRDLHHQAFYAVRSRAALAARENLYLSRRSVGGILWRANDGGGLRARLIARHPMELGFPITAPNVIGWTFFEGVYVGPTEEILFRSLLVGYLMAVLPGRVRLGNYEMSCAGVIVAATFAFAHVATFLAHPSYAAAGQQLYAFALGILYAFWFEKSRSVVAPIVGHNVSDVVEYVICFILIALWR